MMFGHITAPSDPPIIASSERQLWCAVILRALQDATGKVGTLSSAPAQRHAVAEARHWFLDNGQDFRSACAAAGYDPDVLRQRALRLIVPLMLGSSEQPRAAGTGRRAHDV